MLNKGNSSILKNGNKETLEGYPSINLSQFWVRHQDKIKQKLFIELKDNQEYDKARETVLTFYKASSYEGLSKQQSKRNNQPIDRLEFELGAKWFEEGMSLEKIPEKYKNNVSFMKGYERAKRLSLVKDELYELGRKFYLSGMNLDDAPERYRDDKNFINGFNSGESKKWR